MKKTVSLLLIPALLILSGCVSITQQELGQDVLLVTPTVFLVSLGFQYLFFRLWKLKFPQLTLSWLPNFIFYIFLLIIAGVFSKGNPFWFLTDDWEFSGIIFVLFGPSFLTILFIVIRVWLFFNPSRVFTWASITVMTLCVLSTFPMVAGLTEETLYAKLMFYFWVYPGTLGFLSAVFAWPGSFTVLVFLILLVEVLIRIEKTGPAYE